MIHKCYLLVKVQLLGSFGINKLKHASNKKEKLKTLFMGLAILVVIGMIMAYSCMLAIGYHKLGMTSMLPSLMLMISSIGTLIFTFIKSNGVLFGLRDYDMVMSLPVSTSTVVLSRLIMVYSMNLLIAIIAMVPSIIVYGSGLGVSYSVWIMMITSIFIAPFIPMIIAMTLGAVITAVSVRFKHKNMVTIILSIVATVAIFPFSYKLQLSSDADIINLGNIVSEAINKVYPPAQLYGQALSSNSIGSYMLFVLLSIGGMAIFVALLSLFYTKINGAIFSHKSNSNYKVESLKASTPFKALYIKEVRRLFSCSIYLLNSSICIILLAFASIALLFMNIEQSMSQLGDLSLFTSVKKLAPLLVSVVVTMSSTTAAALSMEGKNRWIMCSSPVNSKTIFNAKIATSLTILLPCIIIIATVLSISLKTNIIETMLLFIVPIIYGVFTGVVGLVCNLKFPKYDWTSEYHAVKQSISVLASMAIGIISTLIPLGIGFVLAGYTTAVLALTSLVIMVITFLLYKRLEKVKLFM